MSTKPKPLPTELDHVRNTLADLVGSVGEANSNIQSLDRKVDRLEQKVDANQQENRANQQENRDRFGQQDTAIAEIKEHLSRQDKRFDQLELLIRQLIPNN